jgi:pimeloyl-ACP methyl ester carboxylesterase
MIPLSADDGFHFTLLANLGMARYSGCDIAEMLEAASQIKAGDFESFHEAFLKLARRVLARADAIDVAKHPISARDTYFHAATYFRAADFYIRGDINDSRIKDLWREQTAAFDKAIALLPVPGWRLLLDADGFQVPIIFFGANPASAQIKRPTIIIGNGYDGSQEEAFHFCGLAALERGYNVILYEGPGQPSVRRWQSLGFIAEWEKVVTPVVDFARTRPEVDPTRIAQIGISMGGFLSLRAAAFEHRLAATITIDAVYNIEPFINTLPEDVKALVTAEKLDELNVSIEFLLASEDLPSGLRWALEQGLFAFNTRLASDVVRTSRKMTLDGIAEGIKCPVWVGDAENDLFFKGQPERVRDALGGKATYVKLTMEDGAGYHCQAGALAVLNQKIFDWFDDKTA